MRTLLSVAEAQELILSHARPTEVSVVPLPAALGAVLAAPVRARVDVPAYDNSAMDGFAVAHAVTEMASVDHPITLHVIGYQPAGSPHFGTLQPGRALKIATGAMVPLDATAIIPLEDVEERDGQIQIRNPIIEGAHIRRRAEETKAGEEVLAAGTTVSAGVAGYLATIGVTELPIHRRPRVGIVATGTELRPLGSQLGPGQIYDSNSIALAAAMQIDGTSARVYPPVEDEFELQRKALEKVLSENDMVVVTGGVSVGEKDHVKEIMTQLEVDPLFWKLRQKPGKPLLVGIRGRVLFFGLPGNPASALINYYEYVRPAVRKMMGYLQCRLPTLYLPSATAIEKNDAKTHFIRACLDTRDGRMWAQSLDHQGSHCMRSFAECNALMVIPEDRHTVHVGDTVEVHVLPQLG